MYTYILQCTPNWEPETTLREISSCRESNPVIASPKCATITVTLFVQSLRRTLRTPSRDTDCCL